MTVLRPLRTLLASLALALLSHAAVAEDTSLDARLLDKVAVIETAWAETDYQTLLERQMEIAIEHTAASNGMTTENFRNLYVHLAKLTFGDLDPMVPYFDTDAATFVDLADGRTLALVPGAYVYGVNDQLLQHEMTSVWVLDSDAWRFAEVNDASIQEVIVTAFPELTEAQLPFSDVEVIEEMPDWAGDQP